MQMGHLFILFAVNSFTLFALAILLVRSLWTLGSNTTTIESWEIERHKTLLRRARHYGGFLDGPDGVKVHIKRQEFPYDIGVWANIKAGMGGSANVSQVHQSFLPADMVHRSWVGFGRSPRLLIQVLGWNLRSMDLKVCGVRRGFWTVALELTPHRSQSFMAAT